MTFPSHNDIHMSALEASLVCPPSAYTFSRHSRVPFPSGSAIATSGGGSAGTMIALRSSYVVLQSSYQGQGGNYVQDDCVVRSDRLRPWGNGGTPAARCAGAGPPRPDCAG